MPANLVLDRAVQRISQTAKILLIRNILIDGDQNLVGTGGGFQQLAVFQTLQPGVFNGVDFMSSQVASKVLRHTLIKQQLHYRATFPWTIPGRR